MQRPINKKVIEDMQQTGTGVTLIDIRPAPEYEKQHVPGSINIPTDELSIEASQFSKDATIVTVCTYGKERSQQAAELLSKAGFVSIFYLEGGTAGWSKDEPV